MSDDSKKDENKKDLTGILELSSLMPPASAEELLKENPFAVNESEPIEQVDDFQSLDQVGMMDHVPEADTRPDDPFSVNSEGMSFTPLDGQFVHTEEPVGHTGVSLPDQQPIFEDPTSSFETPVADDFSPSPSSLTDIKKYSERAQAATFGTDEKSPFHLWMNGVFDPYARDKLLLFINDNPIGLNSSELDRQITAGRVLFPRISEFAGIKLIQELRDSGLSFKLSPSTRDEDEVLPQNEGLRVAYQANSASSEETILPVLPANSVNLAVWHAFDSITLVQFLKAEIVEVEQSELFQNLIDRMLVSLKRKALLKGATAIGELRQELKPLRLPSQYQVALSATLYKK
jgi:hypothetical protein